MPRADVLTLFHPAVAEWFRASFEAPTPPQTQGWPAIARGESTLILAPTGSGKTLTAFLWCINRLMFEPAPPRESRCRVLYLSPLKALAVDIERNLRAPLAGIANRAAARGDAHHVPTIAVRTGDTPSTERARFQREPADILITTPESLYLLLTSNAREALRSIDTVIIDEIHALVPTKRGAHLALSLERLEELTAAASSASGCRRRSGRSTRSRGSSAGRPQCAKATTAPGSAEAAKTDGGKTKRSGATIEAPDDAIHDEFAARRPGRRLPARHHRRHLREEAARPAHRGAGRGHGADGPAGGDSERAGVVAGDRARRSGRRSIRGCSSWCGRTGRR